MPKSTPQQIRSSYFVSKKPHKFAGAEYPSVTAFVAEKNDDGTYLCFQDGFIANDGVVANPELGSYSGASEVDFDVKLRKATLARALEWLEESEAKARQSGKYTVQEHVGDAELSPHYTEVQKQFPAKPAAMTRIATHPGAILTEVFNAAGLDVKAAAKILDVNERYLKSVLKQKQPVTAQMGKKLAAHFKNSPQFWENLQKNYDASVSADHARKRSEHFEKQRRDGAKEAKAFFKKQARGNK